MLRKDQRLNLKHSFKWVMAGKRQDSSLYKLFWRNGDNATPLIAITSSTKIFKTAIERNRARRLASAAVQTLYPQLLPNLNMVIMPKYELLAKSSADIALELSSDFAKARVLQ